MKLQVEAWCQIFVKRGQETGSELRTEICAVVVHPFPKIMFRIIYMSIENINGVINPLATFNKYTEDIF